MASMMGLFVLLLVLALATPAYSQPNLENRKELEKFAKKHQLQYFNPPETMESLEKILSVAGTLEKETTIIVKTFGRIGSLQKLLDSIRKYYHEIKIIAGNDGEDEEKFLELSQRPYYARNAEFVQLPFDSGLAYGRNELVKMIRTRYFICIDDDFEFTEETKILDLVAILHGTFVDLVGGIVADRKDYVGFTFEVHNKILYQKQKPLGQFFDCKVFHIVPNFFAARTAKVRRVMWDDQLKLGEHEDFFLRARKKIVVASCPYASISHLSSRTWETQSEGLTDYEKYRKRALDYLIDCLIKHNFSKYIAFSGLTITQVPTNLQQLNRDYRNLALVSAVISHSPTHFNQTIAKVCGLRVFYFIKEVIIWNDEKDEKLTTESISCPLGGIELKILSPKVPLGSEGKYRSCFTSSYDTCIFVDSHQALQFLNTVYSAYLKAPSLLHTVLTPLEYWNLHFWALYNFDTNIFSEFVFLGSISIASKDNVQNFLKQLELVDPSLRHYSDILFPIWLNQPISKLLIYPIFPKIESSSQIPLFSSIPLPMDEIINIIKQAYSFKLQFQESNSLFKRSQDQVMDLHFGYRSISYSKFCQGCAFLSSIAPFEKRDFDIISQTNPSIFWITDDDENYKVHGNSREYYLSLSNFENRTYLSVFDENEDTAWITPREVIVGDWIGVDVGSIQGFRFIEIVSGVLPPKLKIYTSIDGSHWTDVSKRIHLSQSLRESEERDLTKQRSIFSLRDPSQFIPFRYFKIQFTFGTKGYPLIIYEMYLKFYEDSYLGEILFLLFLIVVGISIFSYIKKRTKKLKQIKNV